MSHKNDGTRDPSKTVWGQHRHKKSHSKKRET